MEQNTPDWYQDRCGKITASRMADVMAFTPASIKVISKGSGKSVALKETVEEAEKFCKEHNDNPRSRSEYVVEEFPPAPKEAYLNYKAELICERLTGEVYVIPENYALKWGKDNEKYAIAAYEALTGCMIREAGFVSSGNFGASPDGYVDGAVDSVEVKCPVNSQNHLKLLMGGDIPEGYIFQMQWQMYVARLTIVDFISYDPRMPKHLQLFVKKVERNNALINDMVAAAKRLDAEVDEAIKKLGDI